MESRSLDFGLAQGPRLATVRWNPRMVCLGRQPCNLLGAIHIHARYTANVISVDALVVPRIEDSALS